MNRRTSYLCVVELLLLALVSVFFVGHAPISNADLKFRVGLAIGIALVVPAGLLLFVVHKVLDRVLRYFLWLGSDRGVLDSPGNEWKELVLAQREWMLGTVHRDIDRFTGVAIDRHGIKRVLFRSDTSGWFVYILQRLDSNMVVVASPDFRWIQDDI